MGCNAPTATPAPPGRHDVLRPVLVIVAVFALLGLLLSSDALFGWVERLLDIARPLIGAHPYGGAALFILVSALSAMLAFFSSAVLVPVAVVAWGPFGTVALLWAGWLLGGLVSYAIGRYLGLPVVRALVPSRQLATYRERFSARASFTLVLLLQLGLPSEVPGYLLGLARVRVAVYLPALALAELPFAVGTVLLGEGVVQRRIALVLGLGAAAAIASLLVIRLLHRRLTP
jgi:uncharacterized membrane protein YdjX (TVP38/TMEM64 family)